MAKIPLRVMLIGKTGNGKSALGNFILGRKAFASSAASTSTTKEPQSASETLYNHELTIVDTPGLFSTDRPMLKTAIAIQDSLEKAKPGPHVFLVVLQLGRFTNEENTTIELLKIMFGRKALKHAILIFTNADKSYNEGEDPAKLISLFASEPNTKNLYDGCGGRYVALANYDQDKLRKDQTLKYLLMTIMDVSCKGKKFYKGDVELCKDVLREYVERWEGNTLTVEQLSSILKRENEKRLEPVLKVVGGAILGGVTGGVGTVGVAAAKAGVVLTVASLAGPVAGVAAVGVAVGALGGLLWHKLSD